MLNKRARYNLYFPLQRHLDLPFTSNLPDKFYNEDLISLCRSEPIAQVRMRYIGLSHIQEGESIDAVAKMVRASPRAVTNWISRYKKGGLDALKNQKGRGAKSKLPKHMEDKFREIINSKQEARSGGRLRGEDIREILKNDFKISCSLTTTYDILKRAGMSWITSRSKHPKQSQEVQDLFKKLRKFGCKCSQCGHQF